MILLTDTFWCETKYLYATWAKAVHTFWNKEMVLLCGGKDWLC